MLVLNKLSYNFFIIILLRRVKQLDNSVLTINLFIFFNI